MTTDARTKRQWAPALTILLVAILFDQLFNERGIGLNLSVFAAVVIGAIVYDHGWSGLSGAARVSMAGAMVSALMVVVHHSVLAMFASITALGLCSALAHESRMRTLLYAMPQLFSNFVLLPAAAWNGIGGLVPRRVSASKGWRWGRMAFVPLMMAAIFFQLYRSGNPRFDHLTAGFLEAFRNLFADLAEFLFTPHMFFFLFALIVCAGLLKRFAPQFVIQLEQQWTDRLMRQRIKRPHWMTPPATGALERERRMGMFLLVIVNMLLLVVNVIDISWVWVGFEVPVGSSLKQFVHEGTWMLIISILLSMLILLHLFRNNQNFYRRSKSLKYLARVWVFQNLVLGISVFLRNYHYISYHGLAYKRIGVIVFLVLVLVGLITLAIKIRQQRSFFYLARVNSWAAFVVLVTMSMVDWDSFIVRTNLRHANPAEIDIDNYLAMSDKVLPLVYANIDRVTLQMAAHRGNPVRWVDNLDPVRFREALDAKRDRFLKRYAEQQWQEWNWADERIKKALDVQMQTALR